MNGREAVLAELQGGLHDAERSRGAVCVLSGGAGSGKTHLAQRFLTRLPPKVPSLSGAAYASGSPSLLPICKALSSSSMGETRRQIKVIVEQYTESVPVVREVLGPLVKARVHTKYGAALSPRFAPAEAYTFFALTDLLRQITQGSVAVLFLDDAQWLDASSLSFVEHLFHEFGALPLLVVLSVRTNGAEPPPLRALRESWGRLPATRCRELVVPPLGEKDVLDMSAKALGNPVTFSSEETTWLCETSKGNPRYLCEVLELLRERQDVRLHAGSWAFTVRPGTLLVPPSLAAVTLKRLGLALGGDADAEILIHHAAVLGREFDARVLAEALGESLLRVTASLRRIGADTGYVARADRSYTFTFDHDLTREAILHSLGAGSGEIHARIAAALERREAEPMQVARHYRAAGDLGAASSYLRGAARAASAQGAFTTAADLAREEDDVLAELGLGVVEEARCAALEARADALIRAERHAEAADLLRTRLTTHQDSWESEPARLLALWGRALRRLPTHDDHKLAARLLLAAIDRYPEPSAELTDAWTDLVAAYDAVGEYRLSAAAFRSAMAAARQDQDTARLVRLQRMTCIFFQPEKVVEALRGALGVARKRGLTYEHALCLNNFGAGLLGLGRLREAASAFAQSLKELRTHGGWRRDVPLNNLGVVAASAGSIDKAAAHFEEALAACRDYHNRLFVRSNQAVVRALAGDLSAGMAALRDLVPEADRTGDRFYQDCVRQNLAAALLEGGEPREAIAAATAGPSHHYGPDVGLIEAKRAQLLIRAYASLGEGVAADLVSAARLLEQTTKPQAWRYRSPWYLVEIQFWED